MTSELEFKDRNLVESFRPHYEQNGFEYIVEPSPEKLPPFLAEFRPVAVAISRERGNSGVAVGVRRFRQSQERNQALSDLAAEVAKHPEWTLDIVYSTPFHRLGGWLLPSDAEVREELSALSAQLENEAANEDKIGDERVLLLLLWPLFEAAARRRLADEDIELGDPFLSSTTVLEQLVLEGIISDEDGQLASILLQHKDYISAGFREPVVDAGQLRKLIDLTRRLLSSNRSQAA